MYIIMLRNIVLTSKHRKNQRGSSMRRLARLKKYCVLWYETPLEQDAIYFIPSVPFIDIVSYNTAVGRASFHHIGSAEGKHKLEDRIIRFSYPFVSFRKFVRIQKNMKLHISRVNYRHSDQLHRFFPSFFSSIINRPTSSSLHSAPRSRGIDTLNRQHLATDI